MIEARGIRQSLGSRAFDAANYTLLLLLGVAAIGPFLYLVAGSLTDATAYRLGGATLNPAYWSLDAYSILLGGGSRIYQGLRNSVLLTVGGTFLSLSVTAMLAYGLSKREIPGHRVLIFFVFFTILFGGGMVPFYLVVKALGLVNSLWSLILPFLVNAFYLFLLMRFFEALPSELTDAAHIDGCSEFGIFWRIALPLSMPALATVGLFYAVGYWNDWFWATVFLTDHSLLPLQVVLRGILSQLLQVLDPQTAAEMAQQQQQQAAMPPVEVLRMGAIVVTILPITLLYPFLQRYFVKGIMVGAVKG
ncbi:MAG: carbohydrate ABC transporter permease [Chloroflexi bacterium]|nr:carbohydrate ABC transporter permease [Chloroflexota bacterium]